MKRFLDANVFIRFIASDDPAKSQACLTLFKQIEEDNENVITTEAIIAEVVYVLQSRIYHLPHNEISDKLSPLIRLRGLQLPLKRAILEALDLYGSTQFLDFADALSLVRMQQLRMNQIYSYDTDFDRFEQIKRIEPQVA